MKKTTSGFTIVELLIVIVVIAVLAAISVAAFSSVQNRAKITRANSDLASLKKAIQTARIAQNRTLFQITGSNCTFCGVIPYELALDRISTASGANLNGLKQGDPWGNPYAIDENEGENGNCAPDSIGVSPTQSGVPQVFVPTYAC